MSLYYYVLILPNIATQTIFSIKNFHSYNEFLSCNNYKPITEHLKILNGFNQYKKNVYHITSTQTIILYKKYNFLVHKIFFLCKTLQMLSIHIISIISHSPKLFWANKYFSWLTDKTFKWHSINLCHTVLQSPCHNTTIFDKSCFLYELYIIKS